jgi:hypothetical protein
VSDPGSPEFRHFLTPGEIARDFGTPATVRSAAAGYFASFGLRTTVSPDGLFLSVSGPSSALAEAFHTSFEMYRSGARSFYSHTSPALLPAGLPWAGVVGLGNVSDLSPDAPRLVPAGPAVHPSAGCSGSAPLAPCVYYNAYGYAGLVNAGTNGTGVRVGVVDAYDSAEKAPQLASDFQNFTRTYGLPGGRVTFAYPVPAGNVLNSSGSNGWGGEEALDLEWARAAAPGDTIVMALAGDTNAALYGAVDWLVAEHRVDVLSLSWGEPDVGIYNNFSTPCPSECNASSDGSYGLLHTVLVEAAAEGITVLSASGDCGSADGTSGVATNYPASDPFVVGVGGTVLTVDQSGYWVDETAWSGNATGASSPGCFNQGGSGGGFSPFPRPPWQAGPGVPSPPALRGVPDVAMNAATGVALIYQGSALEASGTSLATPTWAGAVAVGDQWAGHDLGFLDPSLYAILRSANYTTIFHDVTQGSNGYPAGTGWDPVTGIGSPRVGLLLPQLARPSIGPTGLSVRLTASGVSGATPLTVTFTAHAVGGSLPYADYDFVFGDGNATWTPSATTTFQYVRAGVYNATVVVFDAQSNSTSSAPLVIVVGGGTTLPVHLAATPTTVPVGGDVTFWANVTGGTAPFLVQLWYGDGSYSVPFWSVNHSFVVTHAFGAAGGFCAVATARDSAAPADGGNSTPLSIVAGTASRTVCAPGPAVQLSFTSALTAADLPGDLPLTWNATGGTPPLTTWLNASDPYATLCQCGIFRTAGPRSITVVANDSLGNSANRSLSVTLYPALRGSFTASALSGIAPLTVQFSAILAGGHGANASRTTWNFGDGNQTTGAAPSHTFAAPGEYLVIADAMDQGNGNASEAFLIGVRSASVPLARTISATITPAVRTELGEPIYLNASPNAGAGAVYRWNLSDGASAFGPDAVLTPTTNQCTVPLTLCPLRIALAVTSGANVTLAAATLQGFFSGRASALTLHPSPGPTSGTTPFRWSSALDATGMPGVSVVWQFGDGRTARGTSGQHIFLAPGDYNVTATVSDLAGESWSFVQAVAVNGSTIVPPTLNLTTLNRSCVFPCTFNLSANPAGGYPPFSIAWQFGDGSNGTGPNVLHAYPAPGPYNATATVVDALGQTTTSALPLFVYALTSVNVTFTAAPTTVQELSSYTANVTVAPDCVRYSIANCTTAKVPVEIVERVLNASGASFSGYDVGALTPGVPYSFRVPVFPRTGHFWFAAVALGPYYAGSAALPFDVLPAPPSSAPPWAAVGLLLLGAVVGAVTAIAVVVALGRGRRPSEAVRAEPVAPPSAPPPPTP